MPQIKIPTQSLNPHCIGHLANDPKSPSYPNSSNANAEFAIIEVQGEIETADGTQLAGIILGSITFDSENTPWLVIGRHKLRGKRVALDKPYALLRHRERDPSDTDINTEELSTKAGSEEEEEVLAIDLLNPLESSEKRSHKLKRLVQSPNSFFMDVKCSGCFQITTVFSHAQTVVICGGCATVLSQPTGGKARLTEGSSFRRKQN
ncbi:40S ribosomal protein S27 [Physocladia obscura]|uniref:40S ribosomal protein S27 n=1 Tax=Physocladia obscura TaxID=109957 RepID=A0AAD5TCE7_9FUNG|nr:40S ribosomal protein S27 [Physocladia obscura]